jgi:hypothetical protein
LKSNATGTAYLDDFTGAGGTINSITQERYVTTGVGLGQRLFGSSVQSGAINGLDGTYAGGYPLGQVMPDVCGVSLLQGSPYSNMFEWHENASFAGCNIAGWYAISQGTAMTPGRGYSGWMNDGSIISVTGAPNTGTVSFVTTDVSGSGLANADGWHLLSNPYPSPLDVNAFINSGFTSPQYYDASSGAYYGTFTPVLLTGELASMQGFFAESTGAGTVSVTNADRVASTTTAWYSTSSLFDQMLTIDVMGNGFADKTYLYFSDDQQVTNNFDGAADSKKRSSNVGQPTIYTALGAERMALNGYPESSLGQSVALGVDHGANGSFELSFAGMDQFDANTAIYLEDVQEGVYHNIANGNYSYTALASDNSDRFMLHFVLPVALNTVNANCEGEMGRIELASTNGTANRDYVVADANTTIAAGSLANLANDVNAGTYTVIVNDAFGGNQTYTVTVGQDEPINAIYTVSSTDVQVGEMVNFANLTANTTNVSWTIASATINGVNNPTYTFDEVGTYNVVLAVSNGVCSDEKAFTVNVSNKTTSINTLSKDNMVKVFGSENVVSVEFNNNFNKNATVEIQNVLGQKTFAGSVEAKGVQNISLSNITTGYYFVTVIVNEERITAKVFLSKK